MFFVKKLDTFSGTRADPIFSFHALKSKFLVNNQTFLRNSRVPDLSVSRLKIHLFGQTIDTFSAPRADLIFPFHALKSMFLVKN